MNILVSKSPLWSTVNNTLKELDAIGPCLILCCENHKDFMTAVSLSFCGTSFSDDLLFVEQKFFRS